MPRPIQVAQGTEEWHTARLGRATASRFSDIMAKVKTGEAAGRKNYRALLVAERLTGKREETFQSNAMAWGTETEPLARLRYDLNSENEVEECGFFAHDTLMAGASPDGLIGNDGLLEIKCPNSATHIETIRKQTLPYQYYWQVVGQLWITGRNWCDFVSFDPRMPANAQYFCLRVWRDEQKIKQLQTEVESFLDTVDLEVTFIQNYKKS